METFDLGEYEGARTIAHVTQDIIYLRRYEHGEQCLVILSHEQMTDLIARYTARKEGGPRCIG